ncbi:MAG TPA: tetratricopeptide repeat protein, partial [Gemmata sp.]
GAPERVIKWVRRNPTLTGALAAVALALSTGATASYLGYLEARKQTALARQNQDESDKQTRLAEAGQREAEKQAKIAKTQTRLAEAGQREAEKQTEIARVISQFLAGLFEDNTPVAFTSRILGRQSPDAAKLTALDIVARGAQKLNTELRDKPRIRAALLERIGNVYTDLGRPREAQPLLEEALELNRQFGPESPEYATSCLGIGLLHVALADTREAGKWVERALDLRRKLLSANPSRENEARVADALFYLGFLRCLLHRFSEAEGLLNECLAVRVRHFGEESLEVVTTLSVLVFAKAMSPGGTNPRQVLFLLDRVQAINDKLTVKSPLADLVRLLSEAKKAEASDPRRAQGLYEEADAKVTHLLGADHIILAFTRIQFANFLNKRDPAGAARLCGLVVASYRKALGPDALPLAGRLLEQAAAEQHLGHNAVAETALRDAIRIHRKHGSAQPGELRERSACLLRLAELVAAHDNGADEFYREGLAIRLRLAAGEAGADGRIGPAGRQLAQVLLQKSFPVRPKKTIKSVFELEVARYWVRAAQALAERPRDPADDAIVREHFHAQAVQRLRGAGASGQLDPAVLQKDAGFEPLHARPDFKELLNELTQKRTPPTKGGH